MEVIGEVKRNEEYICLVERNEIQKFMNTYYNGKETQLQVGTKIDLGRGYDYHRDIVNALRKTEEFIEAHRDVIKAITNGLVVAVKGQETATEITK